MRTTIRLDDGLLAEAKRRAAQEGRTLTSLLEDEVRAELARREDPASPAFVLRTFGGDGRAPGLRSEDLASNARTLELLDDPG